MTSIRKRTWTSTVAIISLAGVGLAQADPMLTGDTKLACEAILCLSSGTNPAECTPSVERYFSIHKRKPSDTIEARRDFLKKCPAANDSGEMASLVDAIANGAGECDAEALNTSLRVSMGISDDSTTYINDGLPDYCSAYLGHAYTDFDTTMSVPLYVGTPERGGYWVEPADYNRALVDYNARVAQEDGYCDATSINTANTVWVGGNEDGYTSINDQLPDYCRGTAGFLDDSFAFRGPTPVYVGTPERGGYWVEPGMYRVALDEYNARIASEDSRGASAVLR